MRRIATLMPFALLGLVALLPLVVRDPYWLGVLILSMYFALISSGWNLLAGYTGQFSLAPATFAMLGAYTTGLACQYAGAPPWLGIVAAVAASSAIGALPPPGAVVGARAPRRAAVSPPPPPPPPRSAPSWPWW